MKTRLIDGASIWLKLRNSIQVAGRSFWTLPRFESKAGMGRSWTTCRVTFVLSAVCFMWLSPLSEDVAHAQQVTQKAASVTLESIIARAEQGDAESQILLVEIYGNSCRSSNLMCQEELRNHSKEIRWIEELTRESRTDLPTKVKAEYQQFLAWKKYELAGPVFAPGSPECVSSIALTRRAITNGDRCAARIYAQMRRLGRCMVRDEDEGRMWSAISAGCPRV